MDINEKLERQCNMLLDQLQQTLFNYSHIAKKVNNVLEQQLYEETLQIRLNFLEEIKNAMQSNGYKVGFKMIFGTTNHIPRKDFSSFNYEDNLRKILRDDIGVRDYYNTMLQETALPSAIYTISQDHMYKIDTMVKELQRVVSVYEA